jgi:2-C-methyl-D-erythritol 4-phosphate cytidylyltransferase
VNAAYDESASRRHALLVVSGRSELAFHDLHGEPLYAHALRALADAVGPVGPVLVGVDEHDLRRVRADVERWRLPVTALVHDHWWSTVRDHPFGGLLAHDVLCPLVTSSFLASVASRADAQPSRAYVAVRPVTDTLKTVVDGKIAGTIDRDGLAAVASPVVVPPALLLEEQPPVTDFAALVTWLRARTDVELVKAPSLGRRVEHPREVHLLECVDEVGRRVRAEAGHPVPDASVPEDRP